MCCRQLIAGPPPACRVPQVLLSAATGAGSVPGGAGGVASCLSDWLRGGLRVDLERGLSRVAAGTAAPAEAVTLWRVLAQVRMPCCCCCSC